MKHKGPALGNLSSRFFAYIQLKGKDVIRTGELSPVLNITDLQERDLLRRLSESGWIVRLKRGLYLVPSRLPVGGKYSPGAGRILRKLMEEYQGEYQISGPTAFNFYGFDDQVPNIYFVYNNRISGSRTIGNRTFQFIKVVEKRLGSVTEITASEGAGLVYSSKERTLVDAVYDWSRFNSLPRGYDWIREELKRDSGFVARLADVTINYGNQATIRRIGYLLEALNQSADIIERLQNQLSDSRALIPWIPQKPAKGKVNRRWGIIVNDQ